MVHSCPPECFRLLLYHLSLYTSKPIHKNNRDCLFGQWTSSPPLELRRCWKNLVSETKSFTYRDTQWFNSNIWSYISGRRFTVCNLFKSLNFDELVFLLFSGEIGFQCPCLHIRDGFFLLLPSGFLAENICWILGPQSPTPLGYQHSCYMYKFVLGSLAMTGTLTLTKFPAAEDEGKCHDRKVAEMKLSFRPNWQEGRPKLAGGQRKLVWHCIALHCIAIS